MELQAGRGLSGFGGAHCPGRPEDASSLLGFPPQRMTGGFSKGFDIINTHLLSHLFRSSASASTPLARSPHSRYEKGCIHSGLAAGPLRKPP